MNPAHEVLDISSDDDSSGVGEEAKGNNLEWIAEFLGVADESDDQFEKLTDDDSDEVVVLGEVNSTGKSKSSKPLVRDDEDDDDCVILDCDPEKPSVGVDSTLSSDSEELLIVGETGQIACRDFPHSRHLCASLPFLTTQHEKHCNLCHCYVCDSPAPCLYWATSKSSSDHCHATDKLETWKSWRREWKLRKTIALPPAKVSEPFRSRGLPKSPPLNIIRLSTKSRPQGFSSTNISPANLSRSRIPLSGIPKNKLLHRPVTGGQFVGAGHNIRRDKVGNSDPFSVRHLPSTFKRTTSVGVSIPVGVSQSQPTRHSSISRNYPPPGQNVSALGGWSGNHQSSSQRNVRTEASNSAPSQPHLYSQSIPPPTVGQNLHRRDNQFAANDQGIYKFRSETQSSSANPAPSSIDYDPTWVINACQSEPVQTIPPESPQPQGMRLPDEPPLAESIFDFSIVGPNTFSGYADNEWFLEDLSVPKASEGSCAPLQSDKIFSPEPSPVDAGLLAFDFEASSPLL